MSTIAEIALLVFAVIGVVVCVTLLPRRRSANDRKAKARAPERPDQLVALEGLVAGSSASALHVHAYLRPLLAEIASRRLAAHGQALERMPESDARRILGDRLWELVRPDRPFPEDRHGPGVSVRDLDAMLEVLERL